MHYHSLPYTVGDFIQGTHVPTDINQDNAVDCVMIPQAATNDPWTSHTLDADSFFSEIDASRQTELLSTDVQLLQPAQHRLDASQQFRSGYHCNCCVYAAYADMLLDSVPRHLCTVSPASMQLSV